MRCLSKGYYLSELNFVNLVKGKSDHQYEFIYHLLVVIHVGHMYSMK